jgi:Uma2 family endonuclease
MCAPQRQQYSSSMTRLAMTERAADFEWTYDEYARLPDDGDRYEIIRGEVCVTPGPRPPHQRASFQLQRVLDDYVEQHGLGVILDDVDLLFVSGEFLRPDILFVPSARLNGITSRGVECAPELVIEVLSPGSERVDRVKKPPRYAEHGVPAYWILDPENAVIEVYTPASEIADVRGDVVEWQPDPAVPPLRIDVPSLFRSRLSP